MARRGICKRRHVHGRGDSRAAARFGPLFYIVSLLSVLSPTLHGDPSTLDDAWRWVRFTTADGLPSNRVSQVVEAVDGTTWAGTSSGLAWYDGYRWIAVDQSHNLPTAGVDSLAAAPGGGVLVVIDERLFEGNITGFQEIPLIENEKTLPVAAAVPFPENRALILGWRPSFGSGALYIRQDSTIQPVPAPGRILRLIPGTRNSRLWSTGRDTTWLSTADGVFRWTKDTWELFSPPDWSHVMTIAQNDDGAGIAAVGTRTAEQGMFLAEWYPGNPPTIRADTGKEPIQTLAVGPDGQAIVIYETGRINVRHNRHWHPLKGTSRQFNGALCMAYRHTHDLWVGTEQGLFLHKQRFTRWTRWVHPPPSTRNWIHELLHTTDGSIWVATRGGIEIHRPDGRTEAIDEILGTRLGIVTGLAQDDEGHVWVTSGTTFTGAFCWDGSTWKHFGEREGLWTAVYHAIHKDRHGRLWFLGLSPNTGHPPSVGPDESPGAVVYSSGRFTRWSTKTGLIHGRVFALADAPDGTLWFGTLGGLSRWKDGTWTHWTTDNGLRNNRVFTLALHPNGRLWFGHQTDGLGLIDANGNPQYFTEADGLLNSQVWDLAIAKDGALWITTQEGVSHYHDGIWSSVGADEGLVGTRLWPILEVDDRLYIGTNGWGVNILDLAACRTPPPRVTLDTPVINKQLVRLGWQTSSYWGQIPAEKIETRYRLAGEAWSKWRTDRSVSWERLPPGDHRLEVQTKGFLGAVTTASRTFSIPAPFHRRPEFLVPVLGLSAVAAILGVVLVNRRRRYERALRDSEKMLQAIIDNTDAAICVKDVDGRYLLANRACADRFNRPVEKIIGRTDYDLLSKEIADTLQQNDRQVIETGRPCEYEEITRDDNDIRVYISLKFALFDSSSIPYAVCSVSTDITERQRIAEELEKARDAADSANRAKSAFLANVSHEIRTPITAMLHAAELVGAAGRSAPSCDHADIILRNGRHLLTLVNALLDLSKTECDRLEVRRMPCSLPDLFTDIRAVVAPLHRRPDVDLRILYDSDIPVQIRTDPLRFKQAVINLIGNALKFTESGYIQVRVAVDHSSAEPQVTVTVRDTGLGIPEGETERIFEPFAQVDRSPSGVCAGVGLGLPLVRWIAERLGGDVQVHSVEGKGSTFILRVSTGSLEGVKWIRPAPIAIRPVRQSEPAVRPPKRRRSLRADILVAEDFADTRNLIEQTLTSQGAAVITARDGQEAIKAALSRSFDLILMDIRMPGTDGLSATRELRRRGCLAPIIAITASTTDDDRNRIVEAGCDDLWAKPMSVDLLLERVTAYLGTPDESAEKPKPPLGERSTLEDNPRIAQAIAEFAATLPARFARIQNALDEREFDRAYEALHQLVGSAGIHGFSAVSDEAARVLRTFKDGSATPRSRDLTSLEQAVKLALQPSGKRTTVPS